MYEECIEVVNEIFEFKILTSAAYGQRAAVYRLLSTCLQYSTVEFGRLFCAYFHAIIFSCMKASTAYHSPAQYVSYAVVALPISAHHPTLSLGS